MLYRQLRAFADDSQILRDEPLSRHTSFKIGGPADLLFFPKDEDELFRAMALSPSLILGAGTNLLARDGGVRGLVVCIGEPMGSLSADGTVLTAGAGAKLSALSQRALSRELTGLEFASGIPGSVGGGAAMNAGAYGGELSQTLISARVLTRNGFMELSGEELGFGYRTSRPLREGMVVTSAKFRLTPGRGGEIAETMNELARRRREKQPLSLPSAGSVFKRPEGHFAGALIEEAGLKGFQIGGAQVSPLHAGFIVNTGGATAKDVLSLVSHIQRTVFEKFGVSLETEIRTVGED